MAFGFDVTDARMTLFARVLVQSAEVSGEVDADNKRTGIGNGRRDLGCHRRPPPLIRKQHDEASHRSPWIDDMHITEVATVKGNG